MAAIRFGLIGMGMHGMRWVRHCMHDMEQVPQRTGARTVRHGQSRFYSPLECGLCSFGPAVSNDLCCTL